MLTTVPWAFTSVLLRKLGAWSSARHARLAWVINPHRHASRGVVVSSSPYCNPCGSVCWHWQSVKCNLKWHVHLSCSHTHKNLRYGFCKWHFMPYVDVQKELRCKVAQVHDNKRPWLANERCQSCGAKVCGVNAFSCVWECDAGHAYPFYPAPYGKKKGGKSNKDELCMSFGQKTGDCGSTQLGFSLSGVARAWPRYQDATRKGSWLDLKWPQV